MEESPSVPRVVLPTEIVDRKELAPYPGGDMPVDGPDIPPPRWNAKYWEVWRLLHQGYTTQQAADAVGYKTAESVTQLRKAWKQRYGVSIKAKQWADTLSDPRYARPVTPKEVESKVSHEHLVIGTNARVLTQAWLNGFLGDTSEAKERRAKLTPTEIAKIQEIGLNAERASQGQLETPAKGKGAAPAAKPTTGAEKAMGALSTPVRKGPKGRQAEDAGAVVVGLRDSLDKFRKAQSAHEEQTG